MDNMGSGWSTSTESIASLCGELAAREAEFLAAAILAIFSFAVISVFVFRRLWLKKSPLRDLSTKLSLSLLSFVLLALVIEIFMYGFHTESVGGADNLTARLWFCEHWNPINELGYRDASTSRLRDKRLVVVLGDSFTAGHGVNDYRDRFTNQLEALLGKEWAVANVARLGWQTRDQSMGLSTFPLDPEFVVISYYLNDILGVATKRHPPGRSQSKRWPRPLQYLIDNSTLGSYIFLKAGRFRSPTGPRKNKPQLFVDTFAEPEIWSRHEQQLRSLVLQISRRGAVPVAIVWPNTRDLALTAPLTGRVAALMRTLKVPVIDLADHFTGRPAEEMMASSLDGHPHRDLHREVAELLHLELQPLY